MPKAKTIAADPATSENQATPARVKKSDTVVTLLKRDEGATIAELMEATGWLPHTTRAVLTGLRKKGHAVDRRKRGEVTCYHLEG